MVVAPVVAVACRPTHWQLGRSLVQPGGPGACASHRHVGLVVTSKHTQPPATSMLGAPRLQSYSPLLLRLPLSADANDVASLYFCCEVFGSGGLPHRRILVAVRAPAVCPPAFVCQLLLYSYQVSDIRARPPRSAHVCWLRQKCHSGVASTGLLVYCAATQRVRSSQHSALRFVCVEFASRLLQYRHYGSKVPLQCVAGCGRRSGSCVHPLTRACRSWQASSAAASAHAPRKPLVSRSLASSLLCSWLSRARLRPSSARSSRRAWRPNSSSPARIRPPTAHGCSFSPMYALYLVMVWVIAPCSAVY